jgi:uncharacterized membrane protein YhaH (DUF805 family)
MKFLMTYAAHFGRLRRGTWLCRLSFLAVLCTALGLLAQALLGSVGVTVFALVFVWCATAISIQRLHDRNYGGWYFLLVLIPVLGPLWLLWQFLRPGSANVNVYGPNFHPHRDYLQVDISKN